MKRFAFLILLLTLTILQDDIFSQPSASINFTTAFPMNEFSEFNGDVGYGGNLELYFFSPSDKVPYGFGFELGYVSYGLHFLIDPYSNELLLSANKANNVTSARIVFQVAPHTGSIRPYFETIFGGSYIFSFTEFELYDYSTMSLWIDDWTWNYGAGIGIKFLSAGDPFFNSGSIYVDLKVRYMFGTSAAYLDRESVTLYGDFVEYSLAETRTDVITASIGFYFFF